MLKLKDIPVFVKLDPQHSITANLLEELKVDVHHINRDLIRQPARYMWWCALLCECTRHVTLLEELIGKREADLYNELAQGGKRKATEIKKLIASDAEIRHMKQNKRKWEGSERLLKYAEKAFAQRKDVLQTFAANRRQEMDAVPRVKRDREG